MFAALGRAAVRWRWPIVISWALLGLLCAGLALQVPGRLVAGGFSSPNLQAAQAFERLTDSLGNPIPLLTVIFHDPSGSITDRASHSEIERVSANVLALDQITAIERPEQVAHQVADSGQTIYLHLAIDQTPERAHTLAPAVKAAFSDSFLEVSLAGPAAYYNDIERFTKADLQRAELIGIPFLLLALLLVFGSLTAAVLPLVLGAVAVVVGLAVIWALADWVNISIFALNIATLIGLGLGVDYSLFLVSRFRSQLESSEPSAAVIATTATTGKTVAFSASAVVVGLASLAIFDFQFFRSIGIAGAAVTVVAALCALTLAPAVLAIVGRRINWLAVLPEGKSKRRLWERTARLVMKRPLWVLVPVSLLLAVMALPLAGARISLPDARVLPASSEARQSFELLEAEYGPGELAQMYLVLDFPDGPFAPAALRAQYELARALEADDRVAHTTGIVSLDPAITWPQYLAIYRDGPEAADLQARAVAASLTSGNTAVLGIVPNGPSNGAEGRELVYAIRDWVKARQLDGLLGGGAANYVDFADAVYSTFPKVVGVILLTTLVLLAIMFHSLVLPLKAVLLNLLSLTASFGAVVLIFQNGWLAGPLHFEPLGYVDATLPVILFAVLFGLSMDYEVFLLAQVQAAWVATGDIEEAVATGLQQSGRVITSGALVVVVVGLAFATADVVAVKALGVAGAIAVATDAVIVRSLLAPAAMKLAGKWNWWMPWKRFRLCPG